jgi:hypothetical protein
MSRAKQALSGGRHIALPIPDLCVRKWRVVNATFRLLYPLERKAVIFFYPHSKTTHAVTKIIIYYS